jgi:putative ABC transport system permease protein
VDVADFFIDATLESGQILRYRDQKTRLVFIAGGGPSFPYVYSFAMGQGRYFNDAELLRRASVVVLGHGPARDLFPQLDPVGKRIRIGEMEYEVVGVFAERKSIFGGMSENFAIVPWTTFRKDFGRKNDPYYVFLTVAPGYRAEDVVEEARTVMRRRRRLALDEEDDFVLIANDQITEFIRRYTGPIGLVLLVLSSIGLTVGGIGVMNIMLVSVAERTHEIGVRKAVGARRRVILAQFLVESGTLTGIGGALGVALGGAAAFALGKLANLPVTIQPLVVLGGLVFSVGIGLLFGIYPAARAARLDPIEALRHE